MERWGIVKLKIQKVTYFLFFFCYCSPTWPFLSQLSDLSDLRPIYTFSCLVWWKLCNFSLFPADTCLVYCSQSEFCFTELYNLPYVISQNYVDVFIYVKQLAGCNVQPMFTSYFHLCSLKWSTKTSFLWLLIQQNELLFKPMIHHQV